MKYRVIIRPESENDLKEAFSWYEGKRLGLGYDFLLQKPFLGSIQWKNGQDFCPDTLYMDSVIIANSMSK